MCHLNSFTTIMTIKVGNAIKCNAQGTYNSLKPLTWILNLFAINCNIENAVRSSAFYISKCLLTIAIIGSLDLSSLYYKMNYFFDSTTMNSSIKLTDIVQMLYDICQYNVDLVFVYKNRRHVSLEYFKQYEYIDEIIGMTYYSEIKWRLVKLLSFFTLVWLSTSACDYGAWLLCYGWETTTAYAVAYLFLYIKILTTLDLSSHVMHIAYRLRIIGDIVQHYYSAAEPLPGFLGDFIPNKNCLNAKMLSKTFNLKIRANPMKSQSADEGVEVKWLSRCYLQLTEQVELINSMFGFRILLNSLSLLIDIIRFTNIAVRIVLGTLVCSNTYDVSSVTQVHESKYYPAISCTGRQVTCVLVLINLVNHCEMAYRQRDRIITTIDHLLINKNPSDKLRVSLTELRELMEARPINFSLASFFRLDNSFLVSIASVVVTYTIILLSMS